ncbi:MAG: hypothetical protein JWP36_2736 [Paucimonas sp.]|nr:hypothetical protein [Paucimonas sp.]
MSTKDALLRAKLNQETGRIAWSELMGWFASGSVIAVSQALDLIDVAEAMTNDDTSAFNKWIAAQQLGKLGDEQAQAWLEQDVKVWAVVVKPWILVQLEKPATPAEPA